MPRAHNSFFVYLPTSNVDTKLEEARELILKYCEAHEHEHDHKDNPDGKSTIAIDAPGTAAPTDAVGDSKRKKGAKLKAKVAAAEDKIVDKKASTDASVLKKNYLHQNFEIKFTILFFPFLER